MLKYLDIYSNVIALSMTVYVRGVNAANVTVAMLMQKLDDGAFVKDRGPEWMNTRISKSRPSQPTGIAARADWFVYERVVLKKRNGPPRVIFISTLQASRTFPFFVQEVLPTLTRPVVVAIASDDCTFPIGSGDVRKDTMSFVHMQSHVLALVCSVIVTHIFVENLDLTGHPKLSPLPLGVLPYDTDMRFAAATGARVRNADKPLRVFCTHRVHDSSTQWDDRRRVSALCKGAWASFTTHAAPTLSHAAFMDALRAHDFAVCVHGGGLDPSPRAWEALLAGCIPIITHSPLSDAYAQLPCVIIDAWTADALSESKLAAWWQELRGYYETAAGRQSVLQKLTLDYWWTIISDAAAFGVSPSRTRTAAARTVTADQTEMRK